ncbi:hypothetical protein STEG23_005644, partial [Scotinomys teguina]
GTAVAPFYGYFTCYSHSGEGRTFPTHPYFSAQLGAGQLSLYNILKAYSLLDQEVGYCQGLSFVAGILLLHMSEEEAFKMLKFLMFDMGLRKQYRPDMIILQIQMYQLSRLLHDYHRDLYNHLEEQEIGPSLYAAPWFLTVFASQFPLGFVARVFDMIFLQGSEVIFKVALSLLGSHKPLILQHENLETIVDFIKNTLPNLGLVQMEKTISQVFEMDIAKQLQAYEVEYHVLQEELIDSSPLSDNQRMDKLEKTNSSLRKQNLDLLEQLQVANARIQSLEATVEKLLTSEDKLKQTALTLELERSALLQMVEDLRRQSAQPSTQEPDCTQPEPTGLSDQVSALGDKLQHEPQTTALLFHRIHTVLGQKWEPEARGFIDHELTKTLAACRRKHHFVTTFHADLGLLQRAKAVCCGHGKGGFEIEPGLPKGLSVSEVDLVGDPAVKTSPNSG